MDNIDYKILRCLKDNARLTASAISEEINLSVSAVIERIRKMESSGVIKGYTIEVDQKKLGNEMVAIMAKHKEHVEVVPVDYKYSFGNQNNAKTHRNSVKEYLFVGY